MGDKMQKDKLSDLTESLATLTSEINNVIDVQQSLESTRQVIKEQISQGNGINGPLILRTTHQRLRNSRTSSLAEIEVDSLTHHSLQRRSSKESRRYSEVDTTTGGPKEPKQLRRSAKPNRKPSHVTATTSPNTVVGSKSRSRASKSRSRRASSSVMSQMSTKTVVLSSVSGSGGVNIEYSVNGKNKVLKIESEKDVEILDEELERLGLMLEGLKKRRNRIQVQRFYFLPKGAHHNMAMYSTAVLEFLTVPYDEGNAIRIGGAPIVEQVLDAVEEYDRGMAKINNNIESLVLSHALEEHKQKDQKHQSQVKRMAP